MTEEQLRIKKALEAHKCPFCIEPETGEPADLEPDDDALNGTCDWWCPVCEKAAWAMIKDAGLKPLLCGKCEGVGSFPGFDGRDECSKCEGVGFFIRAPRLHTMHGQEAGK